jgi:hypothetical protein
MTDAKFCVYKPTMYDRPGRVMNVLGVDVERRRIPEYFTEEYFDALGIWKRWKRFGLPFADWGWAEHPAYIIDIIDTFEDARTAFEEQEARRADSRRVASQNHSRNAKRR